jgi:hypothetical protein
MKKSSKKGKAPYGYHNGYPVEYYTVGPYRPDERLMVAETGEQAQFHRHLGISDIKNLLRTAAPRFAIWWGGNTKIRWISGRDKYRVWKMELISHVIDPAKGTFRLEEFPEEYCYEASEWRTPSDAIIILFEAHH